MSESVEPTRFSLNGRALALAADPERSALDVLREELGQRGLKPGCSPQGVCGSCAASVDGKPRLLCTLPFRKLDGKEVVTLEGFPEAEREAVAAGLSGAGAALCGYCTPGIATQAALLLRRSPEPDAESVIRSLAMHSCRCSGWQAVVEGVQRAGALLRGEAVPPQLERLDGRERALGELPYVDDLDLPGTLHAAVVWAPGPRARLDGLDVSAALALPGVVAVLTADDVPGERLLGLEPGTRPALLAAGEESRGAGDAVAIVIAENRELARRAREAVVVRAQALPPVLRGGEVLAEASVLKGDVDQALDDDSLVIAKGAFTTAPVDPGAIEPSGAVAVPLRGGGLHVWTNGEAPFEDRRQIAALLGRTPEEVSVEALGVGGAFGAKLELGAQGLAALAADHLRRPVKLSFDLDEDARAHLRQPAMKLRVLLAARPDGRFVGLKVLIQADLGARPALAEGALRELAAHAAGPYNLPHVEVKAQGRRSDRPSAGPVRGAGLPALHFALEGCVDRLAEALGVDPLELRLENLLEEGQTFGNGQVLEGPVGAKAALEALRPAVAQARAEGKRVGVACGVRARSALGGVRAGAEIELVSEQEWVVRTGFAEQGQGHAAAACARVAERCGAPIERLRWACETSADVDSGLSLGGRDGALGLAAVRAAAEALAVALEQVGGDPAALVGRRFRGEAAAPLPALLAPEAPAPLYGFGWAAQAAVLDEKGGLERLVVAQDAGWGAAPTADRAWLEGAALAGVGLALSEAAEDEEGQPIERYRDLGGIKAASAPRVELHRLEPTGPSSAPAAEELALIPTAAALAAAIHAFDGQWRSSLPMKDCPAAWSVGVRRPRKKKTP